MLIKVLHLLALGGISVAQLQTSVASSASPANAEVTAITACHMHGSELFCIAGITEYHVHATPTATTDVPAQFTGCHHHGYETFCIGPDGEEVEVDALAPDEDEEDHHHDEESYDHEDLNEEDEHNHHDHHDHEDEDTSQGGRRCHFHAGVEHCVSSDAHETAESLATACETPKRDYNVGLRIGLLFVIMAASAIGVFAPILLQRSWPNKLAIPLMVMKQFGTGIIIATAFVHLYTHATLTFANKCLGTLAYEGTVSTIVMAGLFLSFLVEYVGHRIVLAKTKTASRQATPKAILSGEVISILVMEAGILFHSLLIGLTLVVSGDSFFITLFIVIIFHQFFEGIALGSRIANIGTDRPASSLHPHDGCLTDPDTSQASEKGIGSSPEVSPPPSRNKSHNGVQTVGLTLQKQLGLAALFAFITPIGMAIGIGVLKRFNGNNKSTIIAIGTLDALSAGILIWVGVVEMWAADWMVGAHGHKAELAEADILTVVLAGAGLLAGMILMSLLGKWA
ncbi:Zinc-regulated transporter 1 [Cladobotryum mycophilum]|uniref:Zinc-regulated transporter 1 n=1 Tax=Cladobotryum mycophilum TaxID=491253 RepID=A0ABR0SUW4_9HYPO